MRSSAIQWCDDTENPVMGCDGCELWEPEKDPPNKRCYAGNLHETRGRGHPGFARRFEVAQRFPGRTAKAARSAPLNGVVRPEKPWLNGRPRHIFLSDMGDALSKRIPFEYLEQEVIDVVSSPAGSRHRWLWLTKRPAMMASFSEWLAKRGRPWPPALWAGTSVTNGATINRVGQLLKVGDDSTCRFISVEPQVTAVKLGRWLPQLDWVIQGGESGKDARPFDLAWVKQLRDECRAAGVPYFLKQLGRRPLEGAEQLKLRDPHGGNWSEWSRALRVRQVPR